MDFHFHPNLRIAFAMLTAYEIVLGDDNTMNPLCAAAANTPAGGQRGAHGE